MTGTIRKCKSSAKGGKTRGKKWSGHGRPERKVQSSAKCTSAKCRSAKCTSAKCTSAKCRSAKCRSAKCRSAKRRRDRQRDRDQKEFTLSEQLGDDDRERWAAVQDSDAELFPSKWELQEARMDNMIICATLDLKYVNRTINGIREELDVRQSYVDCWRGAGEGPFPFVQRNVGWSCTSTIALRLRLEEEEEMALHFEEKIRLLRGDSPRVIEAVPCAEGREEGYVVCGGGGAAAAAAAVAVASVDQECNGCADESSESDDEEEMDRRHRANQSVARLQEEHERKDKWIYGSVLVKNYMVCLLQCGTMVDLRRTPTHT